MDTSDFSSTVRSNAKNLILILSMTYDLKSYDFENM